jgi:hypothetical protein
MFGISSFPQVIFILNIPIDESAPSSEKANWHFAFGDGTEELRKQAGSVAASYRTRPGRDQRKGSLDNSGSGSYYSIAKLKAFTGLSDGRHADASGRVTQVSPRIPAGAAGSKEITVVSTADLHDRPFIHDHQHALLGIVGEYA